MKRQGKYEAYANKCQEMNREPIKIGETRNGIDWHDDNLELAIEYLNNKINDRRERLQHKARDNPG